MSVSKPYRRTVRQFTDGEYSEGGRGYYVRHPKYSKSPEHYIRAFLLIQKDLMNLFDYVEPADQNIVTYSYRIHELLLRTCVEIEANCVAILTENNYSNSTDWTMKDYKKINQSHRLSSYIVQLPIWTGKQNLRKPFKAWEGGHELPWYKVYNQTKHDRHGKFHEATLDNLIEAVCGLCVLLASQFLQHEFSSQDAFLIMDGESDGFESSIGGYFRVKFPTDFPKPERYDFDWQSLMSTKDPFQDFPY